jgi:hypothetical protein
VTDKPIPKRLIDAEDPEGFLLPPHDRASYLRRHMPRDLKNSSPVTIRVAVQDRFANVLVVWTENWGGWDD